MSKGDKLELRLSPPKQLVMEELILGLGTVSGIECSGNPVR